MLVSGVITTTVVVGLFSPQLILDSTFGNSFTDELADVVVRSWSALVALVGIMLIFASGRPEYRNFVLIIAGVSKIVFVSLIVLAGEQILEGALTAVVIDSLTVLLFALYLLSVEDIRQYIQNRFINRDLLMGAGAGVAIGVAVDDIGMWLGIGMAVGYFARISVFIVRTKLKKLINK